MTSFNILIERCARKLEKDSELFSYYNISASEAESLLKEQIVGYLYDAIDILTSKCEPIVDMYDYDEETMRFNFDLTKKEIGLIAELMRQVYYERQESLLGAFKIRLSPSDLNTITPSTERSTFLKLIQDIRYQNDIAISHYACTDRSTGKRIQVDHSQFDYGN